MMLLKYLLPQLQIILIVSVTVKSFPINVQALLGPQVLCEEVSTFSTKWFLRNTLEDYRQEIHNKALFYTRGMSRQARQLACQSKQYVTLWDVWPAWLYNDKDSPDNPMRCIHRDPKVAATFYENMSRAYARMARNKATVMHSFDDYNQPPLDGIWGRVELPAIQKWTDIFEMEKINEDRSKSDHLTINGKSACDIYEEAIEEVKNMFIQAKKILNGSSKTMDGESHGSCSIWSSQSDGFLDGLW